MASLGLAVDAETPPRQTPRALNRPKPDNQSSAREAERDALIAEARQRNAQAFAPWTKEEEQDVRRRHEAGESVETIARARKRSPRAIELRLQRLGLLAS